MQLQPFSITSQRYYHLIVSKYLKRVWWLYALPGVAALAACVCLADIRFLFLLLIYIFLILPMLFTFALLSYGLHPVSRYSILMKQAEANDDGLCLSFVNDDGTVYSTAQIKWTEIEKIDITSNELLLVINPRKYRFVAIPYTAFSSPDELRVFMTIAEQGIKKQK